MLVRTHRQKSDAEAKLNESTVAAQRAADAAAQAAAAAAEAHRRAEQADLQVRHSAIAELVGSRVEQPLGVLASKDASDASLRSAYLQVQTNGLADLLARQQQAHAAWKAKSERRQAAAALAAQTEAAAQKNVAKLASAEQAQSALVAAVQQRLDSALAEAAALEAIDAEAAATLTSSEQALNDSVVAITAGDSRPTATAAVVTPRTSPGTGRTTTTTAPTPTSSPTPTSAAPPAAPSTTGSPRTTTSAPRTSTTTTTAVVRPPSATTTAPPVTIPNLPSVDVVRVGNTPLWVARSIAVQVKGLVDAAAASGIILSGGAYRNMAAQIELRKAHCGTSDYAIYQMPASQCHPPTAPPGRSMHELGLAIDFTCSGTLISNRASTCYVWLAAHASDFGLKNLPSEPWHWSTNGN